MACFVLPVAAMIERPRVLIVDDELGVRESLRAILGKDCDVVTASSGDEALKVVQGKGIDLVTLDLRMPGLGGIAVLEQIKKLDPEIEALIITGYGSLDTAIQGLRHHAFDYISKPFDCDQVRSVVQAALARRLASRRLRNAPEQILATLSHEFRTPLNVIMGYSTMLRDEGEKELSDEQRLALDRIQSNSTALLSYVETLFYMVELDRGLVPLRVGPVRVSEVLARVAEEVRPIADQKGLRVTVDASAAIEITTDEEKLVRLVRALADNAVRYTMAGEVVLRAEPAAGGIAVEVRDTGPGMAAELVAETRDVIASRPNADPPRLLGFGLRLAGRLVRTLGAAFDVNAGPGGTRCTIVVPPRLAAAETVAA
jgi:signal transduction histidine kinase